MKSFRTENYPWSIEGLQNCIKENKIKAKVIAINGNKAIVRVNSYGASQVLGYYSDWCISQHRCSWEQYVSNHPNNIQVFFYNFDFPHDSNLSLVGATFTMSDDLNSMKLMCCFTRENNPIGNKLNKGPEADLEALNKLVIIPYFHFEITPDNNPLFNNFVGEREPNVEVKEEKKKLAKLEDDSDVSASRRKRSSRAHYLFDYDDDWDWDYSWISSPLGF